MRTETRELYFADDGTPFNHNKKDCEVYEALCSKYRSWLSTNKVLFWNHLEKFMNIDLLEYAYKDNKNYLDYLRETLRSSCGHIVINVPTNSDEWEIVWEFVSKYIGFSVRDDRKLRSGYQAGDILAYDISDSYFHNFSLIMRQTIELDERLKVAASNK